MNFYNNGDKVYTVGDIDRLERENTELKAHVEWLRDLLIRAVKGEQYIIESDLIAAICSDLQSEISEAIDATPAQCLAEVKAQAGRDGFIAGVNYAHKRKDVFLPKVIEMVAHDYACQLRQQANPLDKINKARDEASYALQNWINKAGD